MVRGPSPSGDSGDRQGDSALTWPSSAQRAHGTNTWSLDKGRPPLHRGATVVGPRVGAFSHGARAPCGGSFAESSTVPPGPQTPPHRQRLLFQGHRILLSRRDLWRHEEPL